MFVFTGHTKQIQHLRFSCIHNFCLKKSRTILGFILPLIIIAFFYFPYKQPNTYHQSPHTISMLINIEIKEPVKCLRLQHLGRFPDTVYKRASAYFLSISLLAIVGIWKDGQKWHSDSHIINNNLGPNWWCCSTSQPFLLGFALL